MKLRSELVHLDTVEIERCLAEHEVAGGPRMRAGEVARLFFESGSIVLCTFVSPFAGDRERVRKLFPEGRFHEIHVDCDLETCRRRDPKGLYAKADAGVIRNFTGVTAPYEEPLTPEIRLRTLEASPEELAEQVFAALRARGIVT